MLLAGDLFDSDRLYSQTAQMLAQALARFQGAVVIAPGNHDWLSAASPYRQPIWPENVHIFLGPGHGALDPAGAGLHRIQGGLRRPGGGGKRPAGLLCPAGRTAPTSWSSTGTWAAGRAATAPSPRRRSPPRAWTIWPWAMSTPPRP
ncbi:MAG: metallophosphoesterase [Oscillospiraceae bacterium]